MHRTTSIELTAEGLPLPEDFDDGELEGAYNQWLARADARR